MRLPEDALNDQTESARRILEEAQRRIPDMRVEDPPLDADYEKLRWFAMPAEIVRDLKASAGGAATDARLTTYGRALESAYRGGDVSPEGVAILANLRRSLRITPDEHRAAYAALLRG